MQRSRLYVLVSSLILVISASVFLVLQTLGKTGIGTRVEFRTIFKSNSTGLRQSGYYIIQDSETWASIWKELAKVYYPSPPAPEVDFSKKTIIAVFMGTQMTTGYAIGVKEIIDTGLSVVVRAEENYPVRIAVGEMLTQPCHIVEVNKISKPVILDTYSRPN